MSKTRARFDRENSAIKDAKQKDDKLPIQPAKAPQIENLKKITDAAAELLEANEFYYEYRTNTARVARNPLWPCPES